MRMWKAGEVLEMPASEFKPPSLLRAGQRTKFVRTGESWRGPYKEVRYVLTVPGGYIYASAWPFGKNVDESKWDESALEANFHTLRVARRTGPSH